MLELSAGQRLALEQLEEIATKSNGALEVLGEPEEVAGNAYVQVRLSLETAAYRRQGGFKFRDRERLRLLIYREFPFVKPSIHFNHKRFIGQPHVQWGTYICLYQSSETEYEPSDGLFGFFDRVDLWMKAAGAGQLDPEDAPLHPPVAYQTSLTKFVIKADTPPESKEEPFWIGRADLKKVRNDRLDVVGWTHLNHWVETDPDQCGAAAVLLKHPLATEYPSKVYDLIILIERAGLNFSMLFRLLRLVSVMTAPGEPAHLVFGAPMRRKAAGEPLKPHLTVWEIAAEPLAALRALVRSNDEDEDSKKEILEWLADADLKWCQVLEDRSEIVHRRDGGALTSALKAKRVLLLGCGALGSAVVETVLRAGATSIRLVDGGVVKPGILVRQRYGDVDIGLPKARALQTRLESLGLQCAVSIEICNPSQFRKHSSGGHFRPQNGVAMPPFRSARVLLERVGQVRAVPGIAVEPCSGHKVNARLILV